MVTKQLQQSIEEAQNALKNKQAMSKKEISYWRGVIKRNKSKLNSIKNATLPMFKGIRNNLSTEIEQLNNLLK